MFGGLILVSALAVHSVGQSLRGGQLKEIRLGQNTRIYDKDKRLLGIVAGETNRTVVASNRIPQVLKDATVAIEDKRFYSHDGVDYYRLAGAAVRDLESHSASQGGSTITMQLVKNLYDPQAGRTLSKKIEEAYLAYQYEKKYTKDEILREVPERRVLRPERRRRAGRLADVLRQERGPDHPAAGRPAGGPAAGADLVQPLRQPGGRARPAQPGAGPDGRPGLHHPGARRPGQDGRPRAQAGPGLQAHPRGVLLRVRPPAADRPLRREAGAAGRVQGLHHDRPRAAVGRAHRDQAEPLLRRRPERRDRDGRLQEGLHPRDGLESVRSTRTTSSTSRPRPCDRPARRSRRSC